MAQIDGAVIYVDGVEILASQARFSGDCLQVRQWSHTMTGYNILKETGQSGEYG